MEYKIINNGYQVESNYDLVQELKSKQKNYKGGYSLSANTKYLLETKKAYQLGSIAEEDAKSIFLRQKLCGNVL